MDKNYLEILSKNILNTIKDKLRKNNVVLEEKQELLTDEKMLKIIESVVKNEIERIFEANNVSEKNHKNEKFNLHIMISLIQYYVALYNDNLDLLHKLLNNKFYWGSYTTNEMNLFVLDKRLTSNFSESEFFEILEDNTILLRNFYSSLYTMKGNNKINPAEIIKKVANVLKKDKNIAKTAYVYRNRCNHLFSIPLLEYFSEEEILKLNDEQKCMVDDFWNFKDKDTEIKLNLIKNYNYSKNLIYWEQFDKYFTVEEILNFTDVDIEIFKKLLTSHFDNSADYDVLIPMAIQKIKNIKKINPEFNYALDAIVYDVLSEEEIMNLSPDGVCKINNCCWNYKVGNFETEYNFTEKDLRRWIKNNKRNDYIKSKVLKLVPIKKREIQ